MSSTIHAKSEKTYYVTARTVNGYGLVRTATVSENKPSDNNFKDNEFKCATFTDKVSAKLYVKCTNKLGIWFNDSFIPGQFLYENGNKEYTTILGASILPKLMENKNAIFRFNTLYGDVATIKV